MVGVGGGAWTRGEGRWGVWQRGGRNRAELRTGVGEGVGLTPDSDSSCCLMMSCSDWSSFSKTRECCSCCQRSSIIMC